MGKRINSFIILCLSCLILSSCSHNNQRITEELELTNSKVTSVNTVFEKQKTDVSLPESQKSLETTAIEYRTEVLETITVTEKTQEISEFPSNPVVDIKRIQNYDGTPYIEVNDNKPYYDVFTSQYFDISAKLDSFGRCGTVFELIGLETMPEIEREGIGMIKPSGWQTVKYPDIIPDLYLYNRCHLIGYQLSGKNADEENLITGTRYMNVSGMLPFEEKTASYIKSTNNHVLYRVTPVFEGNELVARGVLMEALSVEDAGTGLSFCVFCYNVQPRISINYENGDSWIEEKAESEEPIERSTGEEYVLNTNTKKFHYPSCNSVSQMKEKNKQAYIGSRDDLITQGYAACKNCNP